MADRFGVNAQEAAQTATELTRIRASLHELGGDTSGSVTGSAKVQRALADFVKDSSDARTKLDSELERAAGLLNGLAQGATTLDQSLADAVDPAKAVPDQPLSQPHGSSVR